MLKSLAVKAPPPVGQKITSSEAPVLFDLLNEVRQKTRGPKVHAVYITEDFNASIVQTARFGPFAGHLNRLSLGLPLLSALPIDEVKAVIAHEYGHLAGSHGKISAWIYRVRMTWLNLSNVFGQGFFASLFRGFFNWYGPWFSAYSFVMARGDEYEADAMSARVAGPAVAARALTRVAIESERFNRFWAGLFNTAHDQDQVFPYATMTQHFVQPMPASELAGAVRMAMKETTDIHDTHPALNDRLGALKEALPDFEPVAETGADVLLGDGLTARLAGRFDEDWWHKASEYWTERQQAVRSQHEQLAELDAKAQAGSLDDEEDWTYRELLEGAGRTHQALEVASRRFAAKPEDAPSRLVYGRLLLENDDTSGLEILAPLLAEKPQSHVRLFALDHGLSYLRRTSPDDGRIADWQTQLDTGIALRRRIDEELNCIDEASVFEPAALGEEAISALRNRAAHDTSLHRMWLAKRRLHADPDEQQYILLIVGAYSTGVGHGIIDDILAILQTHGNAFVILHSAATEWLMGRMHEIKGAQILKK